MVIIKMENLGSCLKANLLFALEEISKEHETSYMPIFIVKFRGRIMGKKLLPITAPFSDARSQYAK